MKYSIYYYKNQKGVKLYTPKLRALTLGTNNVYEEFYYSKTAV